MSQFGPFETRAEIMERSTRFVDLVVRNGDPNVTAWRIYGHGTLNDAYGPAHDATGGGTSGVGGTGPVAFINQVGRESGFRSPLLIQRRLGFLESRAQLRRMSRIMFDPDDYASLPGMPSERGNLYVRVQEFASTVGGWRTVMGALNTGDPVLGPIVVVPPVRFFGSPNGALSLTGNAPANTQAIAGGIVPVNESGQFPGPMHIILPRPASVRIRNTDPAVDLLFAFRYGQSMETVPFGEQVEVKGGVKELLLASADSGGGGAVAPTFNLTAVVNLGVEL